MRISRLRLLYIFCSVAIIWGIGGNMAIFIVGLILLILGLYIVVIDWMVGK